MRIYDLIEKKKRGYSLESDEIYFIVNEFTNGNIPDYQMSAFLMAVYFQGMDERETYDLTMVMAKSGDMLDLSGIKGVKIDKHSTGGVGDKTTLILGPLVASCGVPVAKMSGRGLGHTGGTIDKLESIKGFNTSVSEEDFIKNVNEIGIAVAGQTANLAPADKKIYALRDVTATVDNISLIAASIMSKKLASGADGIVLDVKCGNGAFMKNEDDAYKLAKEMVTIGQSAGKRMVAVITDMNEPLGNYVGNALEVKEAVDTLKGNGPKDLVELCITIGARMLLAAGIFGNDFYGADENNIYKAKKLLEEKISNGEAFHKFCQFIIAQGGDINMILNTELLPKAEFIEPLIYNGDSAYIKLIDTESVGRASLVLGGGRENKNSIIDPAVGIVLNAKTGDRISNGDILCYIHGNNMNDINNALNIMNDAYSFSEREVEKNVLIKKVVF